MKKSSCDFIVSLNNADVTIQGRTVLSGITWKLRRGEHWAFTGDNGSGKSTLLKLIRGELWPDAGKSVTRQYCFDGEVQESPIGIRKRIAIVSSELQDAYHRNKWNMTGREVIYTGFFDSAWLHQEPSGEQKTEAERMSHALKLDSLLNRKFLQMSQGEARKILIARALVARPDVLAFDEPCNGLDMSSKRKILGLIEEIAAAGTTVLYATHRIEELIPSITHVLTMDCGKIIKSVRLRASSVGRKKQNSHTSTHSALRPMPDNTPLRLDAPLTSSTSNFLINIKHADIFLKRKKILSDISWVMRKGENWAVIGRNGAGKSTLLKLIAGDVYPALGGKVQRFGGKDSEGLRNIRKRIAVVSPELQRDYSYGIKGADVVLSGFFSSIGLYDKATRDQKDTARHWMDFFNLLHLSERPMSGLSYGERKKILIARAMVSGPDILILDEPCSGLDRAARSEFLSFITQAAGAGVALIVATHHPDEIPVSITHIMIMDKGKIISQKAL
ncbi:MAG: ATP-binding cassette domain-containing protein [Nitrospirae bacterium]|nr:ATP-binding cassette domain-containing protein [Nitrospirota bacterium]